MPNWVYNNLTVTANTPEEIEAFYLKVTEPHIEKLMDDGVSDEPVPVLSEREFSFHNIIAPPIEAILNGEYYGTHGFVEGEPVGRTPNNWYEFNCDNWGVKWDANVQHQDLSGVVYTVNFETPWDIPLPVLEEMVRQYPNLAFDIECEEETGWGAMYEGLNGVLTETKRWDEPNSHQDFVDRDNVDGCVCSWSGDVDDWYDDCPKESLTKTEHIVAVVHKHKVMALSIDDAIEAIKQLENGFDIDETKVQVIKYDDNPTYTGYPGN